MKWMLCVVLLSGLLMRGCASSAPKANAEHVGHGNHPAPSVAPGSLHVSGVGVQSKTFTAADLAGMARKSVKVQERDGVEATYGGVTVEVILTHAGMQFGHSLRGARLRDYMIAEGSDGYGVAYALTEISSEFSDRVVMVADTMNGVALPKEDGPLRMLVSDEKRRARWVRGVVSLTVKSGQ